MDEVALPRSRLSSMESTTFNISRTAPALALPTPMMRLFLLIEAKRTHLDSLPRPTHDL
jgi:hypothetical protein